MHTYIYAYIRDGTRIIEYVNGQKDVVSPDGTKVRDQGGASIRKMHTDNVSMLLAKGRAK